MRKLTVSFCITASVIASTAYLQPSHAAETPYEVMTTDTFEGVIVPKEAALSFLVIELSSDEKDLMEYWTPSKEDVLNAEEKLEPYLTQLAPQQSPDLGKKLVQYGRQYVGMLYNGHKYLYMSFFCHTFEADDWKSSPVIVEDGGDCFFRVWYDIASGTFSRLNINGEA